MKKGKDAVYAARTVVVNRHHEDHQQRSSRRFPATRRIENGVRRTRHPSGVGDMNVVDFISANDVIKEHRTTRDDIEGFVTTFQFTRE